MDTTWGITPPTEEQEMAFFNAKAAMQPRPAADLVQTFPTPIWAALAYDEDHPDGRAVSYHRTREAAVRAAFHAAAAEDIPVTFAGGRLVLRPRPATVRCLCGALGRWAVDGRPAVSADANIARCAACGRVATRDTFEMVLA